MHEKKSGRIHAELSTGFPLQALHFEEAERKLSLFTLSTCVKLEILVMSACNFYNEKFFDIGH